MKRFFLCIAIMICQLLLTAEVQAINYKEKDTTAARLSIEFRRLYIDGDEEKLNAKAQELLDYINKQPEFDHHLYYSTLIDVISFDMNKGHYYRAMQKARKLVLEMKEKQHTEDYYNASYLMAIIYWYRNNIPIASKYFEQAIKEVPKENTIDLSSIYTDYANMMTDENPQKAMELVNKALEMSGTNSYRLTYALTMKGVIAFAQRDGATVLECYRQYLDLKGQNKPDQICDMYEKHLALAVLTVNGHAQEAMEESNEELDNTDRYAIQLSICDYIGDKARAYDILKKLTKEEEMLNNLIMEDDINEMNSDLQVVEAKREMTRNWFIFLVVLFILSVIIIGCLLVIVINRRRSLRRMHQHNIELTKAKNRAQESDRMKSFFIRHVSHEIRTPLNIITGFTQVLNTPDYVPSENDRKDMMLRISENTEQITQIVNELLDMADMESMTDIEKSDETTASNLCQQAIAESNIAPTAQVDFKLQNEVPDDRLLKTNTHSVVKILRNLLQNAVKFTNEGHITLKATLDEENGQINFAVIDTGIGVPEEARERIFERFEKVNSFKEGIGLGLSVSRSLARRMGGDVTLASTGSHGSTFLLTMPL
jgi:signal transduction histidine kinase